METEANVETTTQETPAEFSPSAFSDLLKPKAKVEAPQAEDSKPELAPKAPETTTAQAQVTQPVVTPKEEPKVEAAPSPESIDMEKNGLLKAIQSERRKRQELEEKLKSYQAPQVQTPIMEQYLNAPEQPDVNQVVQTMAKKFDDRFIAMSEQTARQTFKDYSEKEKFFAEAVQVNPQLLEVALGSENPGVTVYEIGKRFAFQKKYGTDEEQIRSTLKKEIYTEIYSQVENDVLTKYKLKTNQPKDLSSVRAAGGSETPEPRSIGWKEALRK